MSDRAPADLHYHHGGWYGGTNPPCPHQATIDALGAEAERLRAALEQVDSFLGGDEDVPLTHIVRSALAGMEDKG